MKGNILTEDYTELRRRRIGRSLFIIKAERQGKEHIILCDGFFTDFIVKYDDNTWACDGKFPLTEIQKGAVSSFIINYC